METDVKLVSEATIDIVEMAGTRLSEQKDLNPCSSQLSTYVGTCYIYTYVLVA